MVFKLEPLNLLWFIFCSLAAWRVTLALCFEEGPFRVLTQLRKGFYLLRLGRLIDCPHCLGFWVSLIIVLLVYRIQLTSILIILAISGAVSLLFKVTGVDIEQNMQEVE